MILFGASGHGKVIADIAKSNGQQVLKFWDDNPSSFRDYLVEKAPVSVAEGTRMILSVGNNLVRKNLSVRFSQAHFLTLLHPSVVLGTGATVGPGSVAMPGVVINVDTKIGKHVILNTNASIDHDCEVADFVHISPNATLAGNVIVEEGAWLGAGSTIIQGIKIGKWSIVGAGAVVIEDVPEYCTVVGNPARVIKKLDTNL